MTEYVLATDSCCDLPRSLVDELGLLVLEFPFTLDGEQYFDDLGVSMPHAEFYRRMRDGAAPSTAQVPLAEYLAAFENAAEQGTAVLFLSFSSGLSGTYDAALVARETVCSDFPGADLRVVDSLSASINQGLLVVEAARRKADGASIDELESWVRANLQCANGYFTLDTLDALSRGGRIPDAAARVGAMLDVKPLLRVSASGELVIERPVRGRRKSLRALADIFDARAEVTPGTTVVVAHGDAPEDAALLAELVRQRRDVGELLMLDVGPVIGSHTGPGMVAVSFWGAERDA